MQEFFASSIRSPIQEGLVILGRAPTRRAKVLGPRNVHQKGAAFGFGNSLKRTYRADSANWAQ